MIKGKIYPAGTIVFPKVGGALLTNKKRVLGVAALFDNNVMGLIPCENMVEGNWLFYFMLTTNLADFANTQALPSIKKSVMMEVEIPLPPLPQQKRIAGILTRQMAAAEKTKKAIKEELELINKLPASLLQQAFEGESLK